MAKAIIDEQNLTDIADAIRAKNGSADTYTPSEMATAIGDLPSGGLPTGDYLTYRTEVVTIGENSSTNTLALWNYLQANKTVGGDILAVQLLNFHEAYNEIVTMYYSYVNGTQLNRAVRYRNGSFANVSIKSTYDASVPSGSQFQIITLEQTV